MGWDHALLERAARTGEATLRVYEWDRPTLSLGRNQPARDEYDLGQLAARNVGIVRRPTGGRALLHGREVTYSVTAPLTGEPLRALYQRINELLLRALHSFGVPAELSAPRTRAPAPSLAPCFQEPTSGEIVLHGRKLVGSAQWRHGGAVLQHGSILLADDQPLIAALMRAQIAQPPAAASLSDALASPPSASELAAALFASAAHEGETSALPRSDELRDGIERWTAHYAGDDWTWRR
ncbi:MAG: biotin/lipoate protein ligase [Gemmatimonadetes bacterium]|nr:biotin/lipoate protein ligase [Gemmatimonadota bacterium]